MELLNDMALFVEVVKARSFRGAAATLDMPNSTLSRRISLLEKEIGLRLLNRTTRRVELTEAGQLYFERCKRIVDEARLAHTSNSARCWRGRADCCASHCRWTSPTPIWPR
ncbi:DNA-binding transcriptional LysR family regulator [Bradyrhizobium diazoefficiens]